MKEKKEKQKITGEMIISDIIEKYPLVADYLIDEYDFYCFNCMMAGFETLQEGCERHGIEGRDFTSLLKEINKLV